MVADRDRDLSQHRPKGSLNLVAGALYEKTRSLDCPCGGRYQIIEAILNKTHFACCECGSHFWHVAGGSK